MNKTSNEWRQIAHDGGIEALQGQIITLRRQLFELRLQAVASHVKNFSSQQRTLRKAIARALTIHREFEGGR